MIGKNVLELARIAALGTHFSPLPRYRGFAPLNWLLINGETETAVNIFYLEDEVDSGNIIDREWVKIEYEDDISSLFDKCIVAFRKLMKRVIPKLESGIFQAVEQEHSKATYTCARNPEDGIIDWNWPSRRVYNFVRAQTYPFPGAYTFKDGIKLTIWSCEEYHIPPYVGCIPGKVIKIFKDRGVVVLCGEGAVILKDVQLTNQRRMSADKVIKSVRLTLGIK